MRPIYHLVERVRWEQALDAPYVAPTLATEGFVHCCFADQVARSANRFFAAAVEVLVLYIDPDRLTCPLKEEPARNGELYPHIYGPLDRNAVIRIEPLARDTDGCWHFAPLPHA